MDKAEKQKVKEEIKAHKLAIRDQKKKLAAMPGMHPVASALARPVLATLGASATAYLDGRVGTADNQHWPSIVGSVLLIGSGVAATAAGSPTVGHGLVDVGSGPPAWMFGAGAFKKGQEMRAKAAAAAASAG